MASARAASPDAEKKDTSALRKGSSLRETKESVAIAFIMAFLFKTFFGDFYVIPTGSMAQTLYGRHKDITCAGCGFEYEIGASQEIDQSSGMLVTRILTSMCPNCRRVMDVKDQPVFNGDRILVDKQVREYRRFDVVVFKNPEQPHVNYIKRLIGLPGDTIRIRDGDIYARRADTEEFLIQRKEFPDNQRAIQIPVYDDSAVPRTLLDAGWPERWQSAIASGDTDSIGGWKLGEGSWKADRTLRTYQLASAGGEIGWLRYTHFLPSQRDWADAEEGRSVEQPVLPSLISDFCAFNAQRFLDPNPIYQRIGRQPIDHNGGFWTSDLTLNATIDVGKVSTESLTILELVDGRRRYRCHISNSSGSARLAVIDQTIDPENEEETELAVAMTSMSGAGTYEVSFCNVDNRLCLWIDDVLVDFGDGALQKLTDPPEPTQRDLSPIGIAGRDVTLVVSELSLDRDIYYRNQVLNLPVDRMAGRWEAAPVPSDRVAFEHRSMEIGGRNLPSYGLNLQQIGRESDEAALRELLSSPENWAARYAESSRDTLGHVSQAMDLKLDDDEYLMMGDNSPASLDSRLFDNDSRIRRGIVAHRHAVRECDLIGRAVCVFWPHSIPFLNGGKGYAITRHKTEYEDLGTDYPSLRFPFYPNFHRMKKIR